MSYLGSRVALLRFRNTEIIPKQPLQKVCCEEFWFTEGRGACCVYTSSSTVSAPDLDGGGPGAQAWWEAPCADTKYLGRDDRW